MKRRSFILGTLAFLGLSTTTLAYSQNRPPTLLSRLAQLYPDRAAYHAIAWHIRLSTTGALPKEPLQIEELLQARLNVPKDSADNEIKAAVNRSIKADFRTRRTVDVMGWRLSELEALLCLALTDH